MFISCDFDIFQVCRECDANVSEAWSITAYLAHAGAIVDNQGLDFVTHLVGEDLVLLVGKLCEKILSTLGGQQFIRLCRPDSAGA